MKCSCNVAPLVRNGKPVQEEEKVLWRQVFTCNNPSCENYGKDIGERMVNIFDESDITEKSYVSSE